MKAFFVISCEVLALLSLVYAAPLEKRIETDPELTAGYFQGDIILDKPRNGLKNVTLRWPDNTVYYKINKGFFDDAHIEYIKLGMKIIELDSCIRFVEADDSVKNYVNITGYAGGCYSNIGYLKGAQIYNLEIYDLDIGCFRLGTIVHEFLHTVGFFHMQSASNRDDYVRIVEENILLDTISNFYKYGTEYVDDYDEEYDYGSVLHYPAYAFSKNGGITIEPLHNVEEMKQLMGQRKGMSKSDINNLNTMYKCPIRV